MWHYEAFGGDRYFPERATLSNLGLLVEFADKDVSSSNVDYACAKAANSCLFSKIAVFASTESSFFLSAFS